MVNASGYKTYNNKFGQRIKLNRFVVSFMVLMRLDPDLIEKEGLDIIHELRRSCDLGRQ